ncbi:hypothetical protein V8C35DRAFT_283981 [Trichoderma chlorosporum]
MSFHLFTTIDQHPQRHKSSSVGFNLGFPRELLTLRIRGFSLLLSCLEKLAEHQQTHEEAKGMRETNEKAADALNETVVDRLLQQVELMLTWNGMGAEMDADEDASMDFTMDSVTDSEMASVTDSETDSVTDFETDSVTDFETDSVSRFELDSEMGFETDSEMSRERFQQKASRIDDWLVEQAVRGYHPCVPDVAPDTCWSN